MNDLEEIEQEIDELLSHLVGMTYNTEKVLELKKKIKEIKEGEDEQS